METFDCPQTSIEGMGGLENDTAAISSHGLPAGDLAWSRLING